MSYFNATVCLTAKIHWVKYNPAMGKIWTNPETVVFWPSGVVKWVKTTQSLGFFHILPIAGLYLTQHFLESRYLSWLNSDNNVQYVENKVFF